MVAVRVGVRDADESQAPLFKRLLEPELVLRPRSQPR